MLEVFKMHSKVHVGHLTDCDVLAINLRDTHLQYLLGYWNNNDYKEVWFDAKLVKGEKTEKQTLGFKKV